jgi:hypothetical protein
MGKNRDLAQYERALRELAEAQEEAGSTVALEQKVKVPSFSKKFLRYGLKLFGIKNIIILLVLLLVLFAGFWLFSGSTFKKETSTFVEQIQELAMLATAQAHVKVVIEQEDNKLFGKDIHVNFPGTKRELLLVVPATVVAGVDLKDITIDDIKVNDKEKVIEIELPKASLLQDPAIQMDKVKAFSDEGLFRGETKWDEGFDLAAEAQDEIKKESIEMGLLDTAEKNAEIVLKEFFGALGYSVEISFK